MLRVLIFFFLTCSSPPNILFFSLPRILGILANIPNRLNCHRTPITFGKAFKVHCDSHNCVDLIGMDCVSVFCAGVCLV